LFSIHFHDTSSSVTLLASVALSFASGGGRPRRAGMQVLRRDAALAERSSMLMVNTEGESGAGPLGKLVSACVVSGAKLYRHTHHGPFGARLHLDGAA
jgi:hypothetical protein